MRATYVICIVSASVLLFYLAGPRDTSSGIIPDTKQSGLTGKHAEKAHLSHDAIPLPAKITADEAADRSSDTNEKTDLGRQAILWGTVHTENGGTVSGAKISLYSASQNENHGTQSRENGDFIIQNLPPARDYRISVNPRGMYKRYQRLIEIDSNETHSEIVLEALPIAPLTGRIVDINGTPVPGLSVSLRSNVKPTFSHHVVTNSLGQFHASGFPLGPYEVSSMTGLLLTITGLGFSGALTPVELTVDSGSYRVSGRVYDHMGNPVGGAGVFLDWTLNRGAVRNFTARRTITDPGGRFSIDGLGEGPHDLLLVANRESVFRRQIDIGRESGYLDVVMEIPVPE